MIDVSGLSRKPSIFVSSTCYDLGQVRSDIKQFIEKHMGLDAVLSDYYTFPIDPSLDTITNCLQAIKLKADIFVLVIGGRYGSIADNGRSITNLEYIYAKETGMPIYMYYSTKHIRYNESLETKSKW